LGDGRRLGDPRKLCSEVRPRESSILRDAFPLLRFVGVVDKWRQRWEVGNTGSSRDDGDAVSARPLPA
jgi:hypothetical protein